MFTPAVAMVTKTKNLWRQNFILFFLCDDTRVRSFFSSRLQLTSRFRRKKKSPSPPRRSSSICNNVVRWRVFKTSTCFSYIRSLSTIITSFSFLPFSLTRAPPSSYNYITTTTCQLSLCRHLRLGCWWKRESGKQFIAFASLVKISVSILVRCCNGLLAGQDPGTEMLITSRS